MRRRRETVDAVAEEGMPPRFEEVNVDDDVAAAAKLQNGNEETTKTKTKMKTTTKTETKTKTKDEAEDEAKDEAEDDAWRPYPEVFPSAALPPERETDGDRPLVRYAVDRLRATYAKQRADRAAAAAAAPLAPEEVDVIADDVRDVQPTDGTVTDGTAAPGRFGGGRDSNDYVPAWGHEGQEEGEAEEGKAVVAQAKATAALCV